MRTSINAFRITAPTTPSPQEAKQPHGAEPQAVSASAQPWLMSPMDAGKGHNGNGHHGEQPLRMYTDEQVAEILQVSLSQLRKWRMKQHEGRYQGPPFRKIGRLVRYPEGPLRAYINGE